jgi:hypothetical protein
VALPSGQAELESMWLTGFLDYDADGPRGDPRGILAAQLGDYEKRFRVQRAGAVTSARPGRLVRAGQAAKSAV